MKQEILDDSHEINISKIPDFLSDNLMSELKEVISYIESSDDPMFKDNRFDGRKMTVDPQILKKIQFLYQEKAEEVFGIKLKPSFTILAMYSEKGNMYDHYDRDMCKYMINISIDSNCEWGLKINDKIYNLNNNEAIFMSGTYHQHGRVGELNKGQFVHNVFIYYVEEDFSGPLW